jgi:uncharacterized alpha/beta hydrolase family protein
MSELAFQQQFVKKPIPTLFLHGFGGSANSEKFMVKQAEKRGVTLLASP